MAGVSVLAGVVLLSVSVALCGGAGTFYRASDLKDFVYDRQTGFVFGTGSADSGESGLLYRYEVASGKTLAPVKLGSMLRGLALSRDGETLYVCDLAAIDTVAGVAWVWTVSVRDAVSGAFVSAGKLLYPSTAGVLPAYGSFDVAVLKDESVVVTTGNQWSTPQVIQPSTGKTFSIATTVMGGRVEALGDGSAALILNTGVSGADLFLFELSAPQTVRRLTSINAFAYDMQTEGPFSSRICIPTYQSVMVYDIAGTPSPTPNPIVLPVNGALGCAFDPCDSSILYVAASPASQATSVISTYDLTSGAVVSTSDMKQYWLYWESNQPFSVGSLKMFSDGNALVVNVGNSSSPAVLGSSAGFVALKRQITLS
eukprot:ANDGO_01829.mRNA.1 hypothetical protein